MAKAKKKDELSLMGVVSAIAKNRSQQRSAQKARDKKLAKRHPELFPTPEPKTKEPKVRDTRSPEEIRSDVDSTRERLAATVTTVKYDLDVPARARDLKERAARALPREWRGENGARIAAGVILASGLAVIATAVSARRR